MNKVLRTYWQPRSCAADWGLAMATGPFNFWCFRDGWANEVWSTADGDLWTIQSLWCVCSERRSKIAFFYYESGTQKAWHYECDLLVKLENKNYKNEHQFWSMIHYIFFYIRLILKINKYISYWIAVHYILEDIIARFAVGWPWAAIYCQAYLKNLTGESWAELFKYVHYYVNFTLNVTGCIHKINLYDF